MTARTPDSAPTSSPLRARGLAAAQTLARRLDLADGIPEVLSDCGSLIVRLAGVVARVSTHTGAQRRDPGRWLNTELHVGGLAAERGLPVVPPAAGVNPGPHVVDGFWISLWTDAGTDASRPRPVELADLLARFHAGLADAAPRVPWMPMATDAVTEALDFVERRGGLTRADLAAVRAEHDAALAGIDGRGSAVVVLHGDAHRGNTIRGADGRWLWIDLEEAGAGPVEWDLAVLAGTPEGPAALTQYCRLTGRTVPADEDLAPWRRLRAVETLAWTMGCAITFPGRYADRVRPMLDRVLWGRG